MTVAYVVACYFGERRVKDEIYTNSPMDYINHHVKQLTKLNTNYIDKIIFSMNGDYTDLQRTLPDRINDIPVGRFCRTNVGMSYGAWDYAITQTKGEFDFYFLIEDDYIPVIDNFDQIFIDKLNDETAYVCSLYRWGHAAISNGIVRASAVEQIGGIPYAQNADYGFNEQVGQVGFSAALQSAGFKIDDISNDYSVPFLEANGGIINYGNIDGKCVLSPVALERNSS